jgi:ATP-dependent helicase/nuclease subunit B
MQIIFGTNLDGVIWSTKEAALGEVRIGPGGLLGLLETRLGITKPSIHPVHRIDEYMNRIEELNDENAWYAASYAVDAWSTARQLLMWRDELVEAGWQGNVELHGSPRLEALTKLEKVDSPLAKGTADRIRDVIAILENGAKIDIASIALVEPRELLPPTWLRILELLEQQGVEITDWQTTNAESLAAADSPAAAEAKTRTYQKSKQR